MPPHAHDRLTAPPIDLLVGASLFLDFDGTLVDIAETPDAVRVDPDLRTKLARLVRALEGRVALISGRAAADVRRLAGVEGLAVAGSHGQELIWADGRIEAPGRPPALDQARDEMAAFAATAPGLLVEDKPLGVALHFRRAPEQAGAAQALAAALAARTGLMLQPGKMMIELRAVGGDKGTALERLLAAPAMAGTRPVFIGDDETDEPAFGAAEILGGAGVLVGAERPSLALYRLADVATTRQWLDLACRQRA